MERIIDVRELVLHPGKYESSIYDDINNRIKEAYFDNYASKADIFGWQLGATLGSSTFLTIHF